MFVKNVQVKYRIMSFDGGGVRGIIPSTILCALTIHFPKLMKNTDLFAGTSAGSFIALALASGKSAAEIVQLFSQENARKIFSSPHHLPIFRPKYNNYNLIEVLESTFPADLRLNELSHRVIVPAFRVISPNADPWQPILFHNFSSSPTRFERVIDVALASSAAPIYFPTYNNFIDGGIVVNNPSTAAVCFAIHKNSRMTENIALFSFGTGYNPHKIVENTSKWGIAEWLDPRPGPANQPSFPLLTAAIDGAAEIDTFFTSILLNNRFFRLNPELKENIALDNYEKIPELINIAENVDLEPSINYFKCFWGE